MPRVRLIGEEGQQLGIKQTEEARTYLSELKHRVLNYSGPFNYSAINNFAVEQTDSPWLLFLNNDTEVIDGDWLTTMAEHIQRPEVGAVGPRSPTTRGFRC